MIDFERLVELVPHYLALLALLVLVVGGIRWTVGELGFWIEILLLLAISVAYPPLVRRLGIAPDAWKTPGFE